MASASGHDVADALFSEGVHDPADALFADADLIDMPEEKDEAAAAPASAAASAASIAATAVPIVAPVTAELKLMREKKDDKGHPFHEYQLVVQATGKKWEVWRRFSEFVQLRTALEKLFDPASVAALPEKTWWGSRLDVAGLAHRREGLKLFIEQTMRPAKPMWRSQPVRDFLEVSEERHRSQVPVELTRVSERAYMFGIVDYVLLEADKLLLVAAQDRHLLSRAHSRIANMYKPSWRSEQENKDYPSGAIRCWGLGAAAEDYQAAGIGDAAVAASQEEAKPKASVYCTAAVNCLAWDGVDRILFAGLDDGSIELFIVSASGTTVRQETVLKAHQKAVRAACYSQARRRLFSVGADKCLSVYNRDTSDIASTQLVADSSVSLVSSLAVAVVGGGGALLSIALDDAHGRVLIGTDQNTILIVDVSSEGDGGGGSAAQVVSVMNGHSGPIVALAFHGPRRCLFSASSDMRLGVWSLESGRDVGRSRRTGWFLGGPKSRASTIVFLPERKQVAAGFEGGQIGIWSVTARSAELWVVWEAHEWSVQSLQWLSVDGELCLISAGDSVKLWRLPPLH